MLFERGNNTRVKSYETLSGLTFKLTSLHNANLRLRCKAIYFQSGEMFNSNTSMRKEESN